MPHTLGMTEILPDPIPRPAAGAASSAAAPPPAASPARRVANTSMTEANWREAMRLFLEEGLSDAKIARRFNLSNSTVASQRFKRGVYRADRPAALSPAPFASGLGAAASAGEGGGATAPELVLPEGDDPREFARALRTLGQDQARAGMVAQSVVTFRMARSFLLALRTEADLFPSAFRLGLGEAELAPDAPAPVLRPAQTAPEGVWKTWMFLGGRGAGKTLAGAAWLAGQAKGVERLALVGPTYADVREVMIEGPSGLRGAAAAFGPEGGRPSYEPSRRRLVWPNGAVAQVFTAEEPDGLRGPQFAAAWGDELCAWPDAGEVLAMLRMGLRLDRADALVWALTDLMVSPGGGPPSIRVL